MRFTPRFILSLGGLLGASVAGLLLVISQTAHAVSPEISLTVQALYADKAAGERHISGFLPEGHAHGCVPEKSCLDHSEVMLAANLTPSLRASSSIIYVNAEKKGELEELWIQHLGALPGLTLKAGRFLSNVGYANNQHPHAWDFVDASLMQSVLSGSHLIHDGLQVKWLTPTERFVEISAEIAKKSNNSPKAWSLGAHLGDDIGTSHSWRAGITYLHAKPVAREGHIDAEIAGNDVEVQSHFTGTSKTWVTDVVWKWAPDGNAKAQNLKLQAEYFRRNQDGQLSCDDDAENGECDGAFSSFRTRQSGWYAQAVYQFMPQWRIGARYERLTSGTLDFDATALPIELAAYKPTRRSLTLDYSPSEVSRILLQHSQDKSMNGSPDDQWFIQYVHSFGAHGAHRY